MIKLYKINDRKSGIAPFYSIYGDRATIRNNLTTNSGDLSGTLKNTPLYIS